MTRTPHIFPWLLAALVLLAGCAPQRPQPDLEPPPQEQPAPPVLPENLLRDGGFETGSGWQRSAPQRYSQYASIDFDDEIAYRGQRSAHVLINRHPTAGEGQAVHGWSQPIRNIPRAKAVRFGGWVRVNGEPELHFGLDIEVRRPREGKTLFFIALPRPPADGRFHLVERTIQLPDDVVELIFFAGITSIGEAWFDDLALEVVETQP